MKGQIRNTHLGNYFGCGNQKNITFEDGSSYTIRNTNKNNYFGDTSSYQQEVVPAGVGGAGGYNIFSALFYIWEFAAMAVMAYSFWVGIAMLVVLDILFTIIMNYKARISIFTLLFPTFAVFIIPMAPFIAALFMK